MSSCPDCMAAEREQLSRNTIATGANSLAPRRRSGESKGVIKGSVNEIVMFYLCQGAG